MNTNKIKKIFSWIVGIVIFIVACYFVFNFKNTGDSAILLSSQNSSNVLKPETVAVLKNLEKENSSLKDKEVLNNDFVKNYLQDNTETIDPLYPQGRINPFAP